MFSADLEDRGGDVVGGFKHGWAIEGFMNAPVFKHRAAQCALIAYQQQGGKLNFLCGASRFQFWLD